MGLLGGFKGKLIGKSKKKKSDDGGKNQVVCVKFNTFSEFDPLPGTLPSTSNGHIDPKKVILQRPKPAKPEVQTLFVSKTEETSLPKLPINGTKSPIKIKKPLPTKPPEIHVTDSDEDDEVFTRSPKEQNNNIFAKVSAVKEKPAVSPRSPKTPTEEQNKKEEITPVIFTRSPQIPIEDQDIDPIVFTRSPRIPVEEQDDIEPIVFTRSPQIPIEDQDIDETLVFTRSPRIPVEQQDKDDDEPLIFTRSPQVPLEQQQGPQTVAIESDDDDEGNFKIHISQSSTQFVESSDEEEDFTEIYESSPITYSSQATSIFFGGEEEPEVVRPRNVVMNDDDDDHFSDGSSASA